MLLDEIPDFKFENLGSVSELDKSTIFYTSGYIGRFILKHVKCVDCKRFLTTTENNATVMEVIEDNLKEEYLDILTGVV